MKFLKDEPVWEERYRPQTLSDCILKKNVETEFKSIVEKGHIGRLLLHGSPGTSKTTTAIALCRTMGLDWDFVNASSERGIDMIRDRIVGFAATASLSGNGKCFIIDEACRLTPTAQDALKAEVERFAKSCSFVMTANHPNRLTDAIKSRFTYIDFDPSKDDQTQMQSKVMTRMQKILDNECIPYDPKVLAQLVVKHFPDNRAILRLLQYYSSHGNIDEGILMMVDQVAVSALVSAIKEKKFKSVVQFAEHNASNDTSSMYEELYKALITDIQKDSIADMITIINEYQRYDSVVPSKTLHLVAMATELMSTVDFK